MKKKVAALTILLVLVALLSGCLESETPSYVLTDFEAEPSKIKPGDTVNFKVTITNFGDETTPADKFAVGVKMITKGAKEYWNIQEQKMITPLNPKGTAVFEFPAESAPNTPSGDSTFKVYLYWLDTGEETDLTGDWSVNDEIDVYVS